MRKTAGLCGPLMGLVVVVAGLVDGEWLIGGSRRMRGDWGVVGRAWGE